MDIEYGAQVIDKDGKALGTVDYLIRNSWTGEISKFRVKDDSSENVLILSPENILEQINSRIKVDVTPDDFLNMDTENPSS
jgi:sporulation protein YlmC with PRC-barrel domain